MEEGKKYCKHCGEIIDKDCVICPKCGKQVEEINSGNDRNIIINNTNTASANATIQGYGNMTSPKSRLVTLLLCFFLGWLSIHRFYVGKIGTGIIMILLMFTGIGEIWWAIDFFIILFGGFTDKMGFKIKNW